MSLSKLPLSYYLNDDVLHLSQDLLGKFLYTNMDGNLCGGMIVETEAYRAPQDKASHAYGLKKTKRNKVMYSKGGVCYVYLCYGIHHLFNVVTNSEGVPHAILIRAIEPIDGIDMMLKRRKKDTLDYTLSNGPGTLSVSLGIVKEMNGLELSGPKVWLEDKGVKIEKSDIEKTPRIGIAYAGEDAKKPWRYIIRKSPWISKARA